MDVLRNDLHYIEELDLAAREAHDEVGMQRRSVQGARAARAHATCQLPAASQQSSALVALLRPCMVQRRHRTLPLLLRLQCCQIC